MRENSYLNQVCGKYLLYPKNVNRITEGGARLKNKLKLSTETKPLVTIITVCLNSEKTIEDAIRSVINQTYDNIEYIIIDGASKDHTISILVNYDKYIDYYISEPDNGLYNAINKGLSLATGKYVLILNSDDWYTEDCVETLLNEKYRNNADIVSSLAYIVSQDKEIKRIAGLIPFDESIRLRMTLRHETMLIPSKIYNAVGYYDEQFKVIADFEFVIRLYDACYYIYEVPKPLHYHRDTGISHKNKKQLQEERYLLLEKQFPDINKNDLSILADRKKLFLYAKPDKLLYYKKLLSKYKSQMSFVKAILSFLKFVSTTYINHIEQYKDLYIQHKTLLDSQIANDNSEISQNNKVSIYWNAENVEILQSIDDYETSKYSKDTLKVSANKSSLKVLTLSSLASDGAGTGTLRRINALRNIGVDARLISFVSNQEESYLGRLIPVIKSIDNNKPGKVWDFVREKAVLPAKQESGYCAKELFSLTDSIIDYRQLDTLFKKYDIIHLHWCVGMVDYIKGMDVLSNQSVVWTLADMNPFTGGCHYSFGCDEYKNECKKCPQLGKESDLAHKHWKIKKHFIDNIDIQFICPSNWLATKAKESSLLRNKKVHIIKNALPINKLRPHDKKAARKLLGLPIDKKLILFGATNITNYRKGIDLLQQALNTFRNEYDAKNVELVTFGRGKVNFDLKKHNLGHVKTEEELSVIYSAADIYLFTSREDNAPLTAGESLLCGTPVVGFSVGYLPEIIQHKVTGYLSGNFNTLDLAYGIDWALKNICVDNNIANKCRQTAVETHEPNTTALRHKRLYDQIITEKKEKNYKTISNNIKTLDMTVHIIIPCLSMADQIDETIQSIIYQTANPNIYMYLLDKGSKAHTINVANKWNYIISCDKKIKPFRSCNVALLRNFNSSNIESILQIACEYNIEPNSYIGLVSPGDLLDIDAFETIWEHINIDESINIIDVLNKKPINIYNSEISKDINNESFKIYQQLKQFGVLARKRYVFKKSYYITKNNKKTTNENDEQLSKAKNTINDTQLPALINDENIRGKNKSLTHEKNFIIKTYPNLSIFKKNIDTTKKLRVCIATMEIFGPQLTGGIATTYYYLARSLANDGHEVDILLLNGPQCQNKTIEYWINYYNNLGIKLIPLEISNIDMCIFSKRWHRLYYSFYQWLSEQKTYDIVHTSEFRGCACYALAAKRSGLAFTKTLFVVKTSSPYIWNRFYQKLPIENLDMFGLMGAEQATVELADIVIGGSAHLLSFMEFIGYRMPMGRLFVQPNIIDMSNIQVDDKRNIKSDLIYSNEIVYFGRLEQRKGLEIFCEALDKLVYNNCLPKKVTFLGKHGVKLPQLTNQPDQNNITYINNRATKWPFKIEIIDNYNQHQANQYLVDEPRIAIMPSIIENSSMAVYETLYHKIPFIATATGGTPELIHPDDRKYCLCKPDPISLAKKIENVLTKGCKIPRCSFDNKKNVLEWKNFHDHIGQYIKKNGNPNIIANEVKSHNYLISNASNNHATQKHGLIIAYFGDIENLSNIFLYLDNMIKPGFDCILVMVSKLSNDDEEIKNLINLHTNLNVLIENVISQSLGQIFNTGAKILTENGVDYCTFIRSDIHVLKSNFLKTIRNVFKNNKISLCASFYKRITNNKTQTIMPLINDICLGIIDKSAICGDVITIQNNELFQLNGFSEEYGLDGIVQEIYAKMILNDKNALLVPISLYLEYPDKSLIRLSKDSGIVNSIFPLLERTNYYTKRLILLSLNAN